MSLAPRAGADLPTLYLANARALFGRGRSSLFEALLAVLPAFALLGPALATVLATMPVGASAQAARSAAPPLTAWSPPLRPDVLASRQAADRVSPGRAALASGLLPGTGQYLQGQRRGWAYLALEAVGWALYVERRSAGGDLRSRYRDFAWTEARLQTGSRIDGDFDYYERLTQWQRSGRFDADAALAGLQPEPDAATFNGSIWARATQLFLPDGTGGPNDDPRYQRALDYYRQHAYGTELLWDWTGTETAQDELASLIRRSDDRFRQATSVLGLVFANHLVSMVDAFVSARASGATVRSHFAPSGAPGGLLWTTRVDLVAPW